MMIVLGFVNWSDERSVSGVPNSDSAVSIRAPLTAVGRTQRSKCFVKRG